MTGPLDHRRADADRALAVRVWWELRHGPLRLTLAETELSWAQEALVAGYVNPDTALAILDQTMDEIAGVSP